LTNVLPSLIKLHLSPKPVTITFVNFAVSGLNSIRQLPVPLSIATSIVHFKLDYCNSIYYKLSKSQLSCLQQIQNSLARTVVKAPKSCHIRIIHWRRITEPPNTSSSHLPTKFSQLPNLHIFTSSSLF